MSQPQPETGKRSIARIVIPSSPPPGVIQALRNFVDAIEGYKETGVWPDNYTLRKLAEEGADALLPHKPLSESEVMKTETKQELPRERTAFDPAVTGGANSEQNTREDLSATPRTDKALKWCPQCPVLNDGHGDACNADFARTLERENNQLRKELEREVVRVTAGMHALGECITIRDELREQLTATEARLAEAITKLKELSITFRCYFAGAIFRREWEDKCDEVQKFLSSTEPPAILNKLAEAEKLLQRQIRSDGHFYGCSFDAKGNNPDSDFCTCEKKRYAAMKQTA